MRIAFLSALYPPRTRGGGELSTHYIAQGIQELGHDVTVITEQSEKGSYKVDDIRVESLPVTVAHKPLFERRASRIIAAALHSKLAALGTFDIVHAHDFRMALALAELKLSSAVVTNRDYAQICGSTNYLGRTGGPCPGCTWRTVWDNHRVAEATVPRKLFRAWQFAHNLPYRQQAYRQLSRQIFISRSQQAIINRENDLRGVHQAVIYNPVPPNYLEKPVKQNKPAHSSLLASRGEVPPAGGHEWHQGGYVAQRVGSADSFLRTPHPAADSGVWTGRNQRHVLYIGTVEWYKGVGLLLEAFRKIAGDLPDMTLRLVGEGADKQDYQARVRTWGLQNRITFTDHTPWNRLQKIYDEASIVIAPSIWVEPFGRTVAEAMARGKVVIAADHGGPSEIINNKVTGFIFKNGSPDSLAAVMRHVFSLPADTRENIGGKAQRWVAEQLSPHTIAKQHISFYRDKAIS